MTLPTLVVRRAEFSIEEPWAVPAACERITLRQSTDGGAPRLAQDDGVVATYLKHDQPLHQEDVVEVFLAPSDPRRYYEIEVNPLGTTFDARIDSPDGLRATMKTDLSWNCRGLFAAVRKVPGILDIVLRIPFASLGARTPAQGDEWRGNFFRIDRSPSRGDAFTAWQPTMKNPPDFHVPAAFGRLLFE
jgi:alpha-galactosidase